MQEGFNDLTRVLQLLVLKDAEVDGLVLPILGQELVVNLEEVLDLLKGSLNQIMDLLTVIIVQWISIEPLVAVEEELVGLLPFNADSIVPIF